MTPSILSSSLPQCGFFWVLVSHTLTGHHLLQSAAGNKAEEKKGGPLYYGTFSYSSLVQGLGVCAMALSRGASWEEC